MGKSVRSRLLYGKMPRDVEDELSPLHIEKTWELLKDKSMEAGIQALLPKATPQYIGTGGIRGVWSRVH